MPNVIQDAVGSESVNTVHTVSFSAIASGNTGLVQFKTNQTVSSVVDNQSNSYTLDHSSAGIDGGAWLVLFYRASNITNGPTQVTVTLGASGLTKLYMEEANGLDNASPEDNSGAGAEFGNGQTNRTFNFTSNSDNCLGVVFNDMNNNAVTTGTNGWTAVDGADVFSEVIYNPDLGTAGSEAATWTVSNASHSTLPVFVTYKAAGGAGNVLMGQACL